MHVSNIACDLHPAILRTLIVTSGSALGQRQYTLEGIARCVNVGGSVHWMECNSVGEYVV